ncbi:MAG: DinB family protein [Gemmatimonadetes bacterium]|jgi:hypothetical protein|nr:DinB family protein [Gemmatimonadota bacterium]
MIRAPRDWTFRGRPGGEWLFLVAFGALGVNAIHNGLTADFHGVRQFSVQAANVVFGLSALGVVVAIVTGRRYGISLLWVFAGGTLYAATMAAWSYGGESLLGAANAFVAVLLVDVGLLWYGTRRLHAAITQQRWPALMADHAAAADEFVEAISALTGAEWTVRPSPEAWSAAEITEHLARTYSQYAGEARGKNSLRIRLGLVKRTLARIVVKPRLLAGAAFPKARAPRELRPSSGPATPADGVALFRATGGACLRDLEILHVRRPHRRLVHPYLGALPLYELVLFAAQHIRHHCRQLPRRIHDVAP